MDIWQFTSDEMMEMCKEEPDKAAHRAFYTGTHDNNTLIGFLGGRSDAEESDYETEALEIIEQIYESPAVLAMLQLQDVLMLGEEARMNVPGISEGNWTWKAAGSSIEEAFPDAVERAEWLSDLSQKTGRLAR
jgi:4-alpha-glucanotransferase